MTATDTLRSTWNPADDLLLKNAMQRGSSLISLAKGAVKFSRKYTLREIRDRWHSLLYDPDIANQSSAHMAILALSGSDPPSKSQKRKNESIRREYYTMRKRIKNDFFNSQNVVFFQEPKFQDDCLANDLGFEEKDFEILRQVFPESLMSVPTDATVATTTIVDNPVNDVNNVINDKPGLSETKNDKLFGGKHHYNSPISDNSASSTRLPLWKVMEDISAPDMPVDLTNAENQQVVDDMPALYEDKSLPEFDEAHGLINCIEYTDSLLNFPNEDDIGIMDVDAKEANLCSADAATPTVASVNLEESKDPKFDSNQELNEGEIICSLNTEDTDIPCNDDIFLLVHASSRKIVTSSIGPLSSSSHKKDDEKVLNKATNGKDPPSLTRSIAGGPSVSNCGPPDCQYLGPLSSKTLTIHKHVDISRNGMMEKDASKVEHKGLSSSVKMADVKSVNDTYVSEKNSDSDDDIPYFSDVEPMILEKELVHGRECITNEVAKYKTKDAKRMIMRLEQTAHSSFQRFMSSHEALAIFYSRRLTHYIKKTEVTIGRSTENIEVDIDLRKEGRANKISRRQAIIKMETDGSFTLKNLGNPIILNGIEVTHGEVVALASNSLIEMRGMFFMFEINDKYVRRFLANKLKAVQ
ncbi:uncharacterized protein LOC143566346 isoform X2 [Bidens hawaiensis]|uniref:uncharacterized protein LOC143566346 isoform X2 n=1 Tax=Bidens hawaiensis TaxID=980011 RepID=UPI00404AE786